MWLCASQLGAVALITVEPWAGLAAVTDQVIQDFATIITYWEKVQQHFDLFLKNELSL
jgi:hypothetical protein